MARTCRQRSSCQSSSIGPVRTRSTSAPKYLVHAIYAALEVARRRRGTHFAPELVDVFRAHPYDVFDGIGETPSWDAVISSEPGLGRWLTDDEMDAALEALADYTDVKSTYTLGHSRGVAELAAAAGHALGLPGRESVNRLRSISGRVSEGSRLLAPDTSDTWVSPSDPCSSPRRCLNNRVLADSHLQTRRTGQHGRWLPVRAAPPHVRDRKCIDCELTAT